MIEQLNSNNKIIGSFIIIVIIIWKLDEIVYTDNERSRNCVPMKIPRRQIYPTTHT